MKNRRDRMMENMKAKSETEAKTELRNNSLGLVLPSVFVGLSNDKALELVNEVERELLAKRVQAFKKLILADNHAVPEHVVREYNCKFMDFVGQREFLMEQISSGNIVEKSDVWIDGKKRVWELENKLRWINKAIYDLCDEAGEWGIGLA